MYFIKKKKANETKQCTKIKSRNVILMRQEWAIWKIIMTRTEDTDTCTIEKYLDCIHLRRRSNYEVEVDNSKTQKSCETARWNILHYRKRQNMTGS